mmetsp:Transcript_47378/g.122568  ORF Transcript_47378/g.122568 Transcript_47378/m.122568 type:complete len:294 (-) Transcript_47378:1435-2316(-)
MEREKYCMQKNLNKLLLLVVRRTGVAGRVGVPSVEGLADLHVGLVKGIHLFLEFLSALSGVKSRAEVGDFRLDSFGIFRRKLVLVLVQALFGRINKGLGVVFSLYKILAVLVSSSVCLGIANHALDIILRETSRAGDGDLLFFVRCLVLSRHVDNTVGVDVEGYLHLGYSTGGRRDTNKVKVTKELVVSSHLTLTLEHLDGHLSLVICSSRENLALLGGDGCVPVDKAGENTAESLNSERKRGHVEKEHILDNTLEYTTLNSGSHSNDFIRVYTTRGVFAKNILYGSLYHRHP